MKVLARPSLRPEHNTPKVRPQTPGQTGDKTSLSPDAKRDSKLDAAWKKFNNPGLWNKAGVGRKDVQSFKKWSHEEAFRHGKKGTPEYRDAYRRSMIDKIGAHAGAAQDSREAGDPKAVEKLHRYAENYRQAEALKVYDAPELKNVDRLLEGMGLWANQ